MQTNKAKTYKGDLCPTLDIEFTGEQKVEQLRAASLKDSVEQEITNKKRKRSKK